MTATALVRHSPAELALVGPIGSLDAYFDAIGRIPILSREEETVLATRLRGEDDIDAARREALYSGWQQAVARVSAPGSRRV